MALTEKEIWQAVDKNLSDSDVKLSQVLPIARSIEAAATAPLLEQIAQLEETVQVAYLILSGRDERIAQLEQQLAEARKDAERYRWLRKDRPILLLTGYFGNGCVNRTIVEVDAAIDAAIAKVNAKGGEA